MWQCNSHLFSDLALSDFAMFENKILPSNRYKVQDYQKLLDNLCAELCRMHYHIMNTTCQSFELVGTDLYSVKCLRLDAEQEWL